MAETPSQSFSQIVGANTGTLRSRWKRPMREALKTPRSLRLFASAGPKTPHVKKQSYGYEGLLNKTWRIHALSPLYKFNTSPVSLRQYGRSLDIAYSKGALSSGSNAAEESTHSHFEVYHGLSFHRDDPDAVRIQVMERQDHTEKVVLTAVLCSVDIEDPGVLDETISQNFTFYPLVLVSGTKQRAEIFLDWLQRHFDCRSSPMEFTDPDLRWFLVLGCRQEGVKPQPILMQYDLKEACEGIDTIDCKFESSFCKEFWDKMQQENPHTEEFLTENQVSRYVSALEDHLEYTMHIIFSKLSLKEVGTPVCYVAKDGKLKLLDSRGVYVVLHMVCQMITSQFVQGYSFIV